MNRRDLLRGIGYGTTAAVVLATPGAAPAAAAAILLKPKPAPLPPVVAGQVLTAQTINDIVDRLNTLTENQ